MAKQPLEDEQRRLKNELAYLRQASQQKIDTIARQLDETNRRLSGKDREWGQRLADAIQQYEEKLEQAEGAVDSRIAMQQHQAKEELALLEEEKSILENAVALREEKIAA